MDEISPTSPLKVAIIGAGPAGCTLALLLLKSDLPISVTIFEAEASPDVRLSGGTLDLHKDTGLAAIKELGLYDQFLALARSDGDSLQLFSKNKTRYLNLPSSSSSKGIASLFAQNKPEIDRIQLRKLLLDCLPPGTIKWKSKFLSLNTFPTSSELLLNFSHGVEKGYDLVVGADGAFSKVRTALTDTQVQFSKIGGFTARIPDAEMKHAELYQFVRRGSIFAFGDRKEIIAQQMGDGSLSVTVWLQLDSPTWKEELGFDVHDGMAVIKGLKKMFVGWDETFLGILDKVDPGSVEARSLFHLPIGERWASQKVVTIIGDAAHLMTPFIGEGVNAAMKDALDLSGVICGAVGEGKGRKEMLGLVGESEEVMMRRVEGVQRKTEDMKNLMLFEDESPGSTIGRYVVRSMSDEVGWCVLVVVKVVVYSWFWAFNLFV